MFIEPFVRVAQTIHRFLLADDTDIVSRQVVGVTYQHAIDALGISDATCLGEQLINRYGKGALDLLNVRVDGSSMTPVARYKSPPIGLAKNALIIDFLFGSYDRFVKSTKTIELDFSDIKLAECKETIMQEFRGQPGIGTRQIYQRFPEECAFVVRFDSAWVNENFYRHDPMCPSLKRRREVDDRLVRHMKDQLVKICEKNRRPMKITRTLLTHGFKSFHHIARDIHLYPQSAAFIDKVVESSEHYVCRLAKYLWLARETAAQIHQATGLTYAEAASLAREPVPKKGQEPAFVLKAIQARRLRLRKARS
ncbi:hypothetical protein VSR82_34580 [Burkholderia sp. JPY481]